MKKWRQEDVQTEVCCAQVFITYKHDLIFHCLLCTDRHHSNYNDFLQHIFNRHNYNCLRRIEEVYIEQDPKNELLTYETIEIEGAKEDLELLSVDREAETSKDDIKAGNFCQIKDIDDLKEECEITQTSEENSFQVAEETSGQALVNFKGNEAFSKVVSSEDYENLTVGHLVKEKITKRSQTKCRKCNKPNRRPVDMVETKESMTCDEITDSTNSNMPQHKIAKQYKCPYCECTYKSRVAHNNHVRSHDVVKCQDCGRIFESQVKYKQHSRIHGERKHECNICGDSFVFKTNLNTHLLRHGGVKEFACSHCKKRFVTKTELKQHERIHTGERPFVCADCGKAFANSSFLVVHQRRHQNLRPFKCKYCGSVFHDGSTLKRHLQVHSTDRNYSCKHCAATFKGQKSLFSHMKLHANKREYVCHICNNGFNQRASLTAHLKSKHKVARNVLANDFAMDGAANVPKNDTQN